MTTQDFIPLFDLDYDSREEEAVQRVLKSKWLTMGEETQAFEREFAEYIGIRHAIAVCNCTAALHLACLAVEVAKESEVICPSLTFVATSNSIRYAGAQPVFADIRSMEDWTISPEEIERKITPRTKAIMVMHYAGFSCDMEAITQIAQRHGLPIIEDVAHAPGSMWQGKKLGALGDVSCFSFFSNKNLSTGEGGMICTHRDDWAEKIRLWRSHGMTSLTLDRHKGHNFSYDVVDMGFNYRIGEIQAALGREQLKKLDANNASRCRVAEMYKEAFGANSELTVPFQYDTHQHATQTPNYHIFPVLLPVGTDRQACMKRVREKGIQTSIHYRPVHTFSYYRKALHETSLPFTEEIAQRELTLPMYPGLREEQVRIVVKTLQESIRF